MYYGTGTVRVPLLLPLAPADVHTETAFVTMETLVHMAPLSEKRTMEHISGDRRENRRYELVLELKWKLVRRRKVLESGSGRTLDLSSGGVLFEAGRPLPVGLQVEMSIAWPALLHNVAPMQLVVSGRVVRTDGARAAIQMVQHEFRTAGASVSEIRPGGSPGGQARHAPSPFAGSSKFGAM